MNTIGTILDFTSESNKELTFYAVIPLAINVSNIFIRRTTWPKQLYAQVKLGVDNKTMIHFCTIDDNCDMFPIGGWHTSIDINDCIACNWMIYRAIVA